MDKTTAPDKPRLSFSQHTPKHQIAFDSTSLGALKRCPRYYQYNIIEGYASRGESVHLRFGSEYNNALVTYHQARAKGQDPDEAELTALRYAFTHTWDNELGRPWTSDDTAKSRETLIRTIIWYLDQFRDDPLETLILADGTPAVELSCRIDTDMPSGITGEHYMLCGYLDRVVVFNGQPWITDWKSSKYQLDARYFQRYSPDNQMSCYTFMGNIVLAENIGGIVIDACQLGVTFSRFQRGHVSRTKPQLEEWFADALHHIRLNESFVRNDYWPQNDTSCSMYGGCPYQTVCAASPEIRPRLLDGLFHRRSWDPLLVREI